MEELIQSFLKHRPKVVAAYGYGSGVFKQAGYSENEKSQIDLILIVKNLKKWHQENSIKNPNDYSITGRLFIKAAPKKLLTGKTGLTYLSNITYLNQEFKYGVVEEHFFLEALKNWSSFYLPGRFQKPILEIKSTDEIREQIDENRYMGLFIAALLSKPDSTIRDLFFTLCSLSYIGDSRMKFAENPQKVQNIVEGSFEEFLKLYQSDLKDILEYKKKMDQKSNWSLFKKQLPQNLQKEITTSDKTEMQKQIMNFFQRKNHHESLDQTIRSLETNGIVKGTKYALAKVHKRLK